MELTLAQVQGGNVAGTVKDAQGGVLPGAMVTLRGLDATHASTTNATGQYRFLELAPGAYTLTVELDRFASLEQNVIVAVGRNVELPVALAIARRTETVTVTAAPMIDPTITGTAINFTSDELTRIPTSRDPFALMRGVPGVLLDQVNVGGNETGQQPMVLGKGSRQQDTSWTIDGVEITDMGAPGQAPTYFNFDSFEEVHVSTAGNDIRSRTGGVGINMVTKRGGNQFHGGVRSYFSNDRMESANVPDELKALTIPVTPADADHTVQTADYGFELGGPLLKDTVWFYGSLAQQDIRVFRRSTRAIDRTELRNPQLKVNWQATQKDMINFLFFNGSKIKSGRTNPVNVSTLEEFAATHHQDNAYSEAPLHGLWKIGDDRVIGSNMFLSAKYAYYNTGFQLTPEGGMDAQAGRNANATTRAYGSTVQSLNVRPQHSITTDVNEFVTMFGLAHNVKYGIGFRRVLSQVEVEWPGNGIVAIEQSGPVGSGTGNRAIVYRQSNGANVVKYFDVYVGDSIAFNRFTIDAAVRYDRQWGEALASETAASKAFPALIPGAIFAGYKFLAPPGSDEGGAWSNISPRVGVSYRLDASGKTVAKASYSRFAGQLAATTVGTLNLSTSTTPGNVTYVWNDLNADRFAQANEVDTTRQVGAAGGGFNVTDPTATATTTNQLDPNLEAPITRSFVVGMEHELRSNVAVMVDYSYSRTSNLFGNLTGGITPRVGIPLSAYVPAASSPLTGTLPDGTAYSVPVFSTPAGATAAGFVTRNIPGYYTDYHGLEVNLVKRLSDRWMGRMTMALNNAREHFSSPDGRYNTNGNPTGTPQEPLIDGGQFAPTTAVTGGIFLNSKWQFTANGMYVAPYGVEIAANVFGRQGYPFPIYRGSIGLGLDTNQRVLVSPTIDAFRMDNVWLTDLRFARPFRLRRGAQTVSLRLIGDIFNLFNSNTALARTSDIGSTATFNTLSRNVSPRIFRVGLVVGL